MEELLAISSTSNWKKSKRGDHVVLSVSEDKASGNYQQRWMMTVKVSMLRLFEFLKNIENRKYIYPSDVFESCNLLNDLSYYKEYRLNFR